MCTCESFVDGREREVNLKLGKENHRVKGSYNFPMSTSYRLRVCHFLCVEFGPIEFASLSLLRLIF